MPLRREIFHSNLIQVSLGCYMPQRKLLPCVEFHNAPVSSWNDVLYGGENSLCMSTLQCWEILPRGGRLCGMPRRNRLGYDRGQLECHVYPMCFRVLFDSRGDPLQECE
jgi:hypothetical protein